MFAVFAFKIKVWTNFENDTIKLWEAGNNKRYFHELVGYNI